MPLTAFMLLFTIAATVLAFVLVRRRTSVGVAAASSAATFVITGGAMVLGLSVILSGMN